MIASAEGLPIYGSATREDAEIEIALVSHYSGTASISEEEINYEISMIYHRPQTSDDCAYEIKLDYYLPDPDRGCQTLSYWAETCVWPESIEQEPCARDLNGDGNDDFLIELGIIGHRRTSACFVYDPKEGQYVIVSGFDSLHTSRFDSEKGYFRAELDVEFADYTPGAQPYDGGIEKYCIDGENLVFIGRLLYKHWGEGEGYRYTEEQLINGEMVVVNQNASKQAIDLSNW